MPLSEDTQKRIRAIKQKVEEVGEVMGVPRGEAAALVAVDAIQQQASKADARQAGWVKIWAWFKGSLSHASEEARKIRLD